MGWYALHVGGRPLAVLGEDWLRRMEEAWPDAPPEDSLPSSCIVGLIHISEQRRPADCEHQKVWAAGPVCQHKKRRCASNEPSAQAHLSRLVDFGRHRRFVSCRTSCDTANCDEESESASQENCTSFGMHSMQVSETTASQKMQAF